jgi:plastocyanin
VRRSFLSEQDAFRSLLLVIVALVLISIVAVLAPTWFALAVLAIVFLALAARAAQLRIRRLRSPDVLVKMAPPHLGARTERRVLVIASDTLGEESLLDELESVAATPHTQALLLVPARVSLGARLTGAVDGALDEARTRMNAALARFGDQGIVAGRVSASDPLEAIEDTFATFVPDEVIVCTRGERARGGLEPRLAALVRERFAVPVRHLVFEPGASAWEPDRETETRYRRRHDEMAARRFGLRARGAGIAAALLMSVVALLNTTGRHAGSAVPHLSVNQAIAATPVTGTSPAHAVIELKVVPEGKRGPEGKLHDDFTVTDFHVTVGRPVTLRIDNTDSVPHSITAREAGVNIVASPGTHSYTLLVQRAGRFEWHCALACDPWSMAHVGFMRGFITATAA